MYCLVRFVELILDLGCLRIGLGCFWGFWKEEAVNAEAEESDVPGRVLKFILKGVVLFESVTAAVVGGGGK